LDHATDTTIAIENISHVRSHIKTSFGQTDIHSKTVEDWFEVQAKKLPSQEQFLLLEKAIHAIEERASSTLSSITMTVILDRVLYQSQQEFPILKNAKMDESLLDFTAVDKTGAPEKFIEALIYLLVELLRVLARLTANIITTPLHNELKKISSTDSGES
jgi:hypothetical protein